MNLEDLRRLREQAQRELAMRSGHQRFRVVICMGTSGLAKGSREVMDAMIKEIERLDLTEVEVVATGSSGAEELEPILTVEEQDQAPVVYAEVTPEIGRRIIDEHIGRGRKLASNIMARPLPREVG